MFDFYFPEWFFTALNLVILTAVLTKVLWKPVGKILDARQTKITQALEDAEAIRIEKQAMDGRRTALAEELDKKTASQMQEARVRAGREYDRIVAEAEDKARTILSQAQTQAERERDGILRAAKSEVVSAALELTGALLGAQMTGEKNAQLIETILTRRLETAQTQPGRKGRLA